MADPLKYSSWGGAIQREIHVDPDNPYTFTQKTSVTLPDSFFTNNRALEEEINPKSSMRLLARVPMTVYEQSEREQWDDAAWRRYLNDPDNAAFRVYRGRV